MRFRDPNNLLHDFTDEFLVVCPRCQACAFVKPRDPTRLESSAPRRLACPKCGFNQDWTEGPVTTGTPYDSYFSLPLWLQTPCCGEILWAHNLRHLTLLEGLVRSSLREHRPDENLGWRNKSLANRLPKAFLSRKNRQQVLKAIAKLRQSVPG